MPIRGSRNGVIFICLQWSAWTKLGFVNCWILWLSFNLCKSFLARKLEFIFWLQWRLIMWSQRCHCFSLVKSRDIQPRVEYFWPGYATASSGYIVGDGAAFTEVVVMLHWVLHEQLPLGVCDLSQLWPPFFHICKCEIFCMQRQWLRTLSWFVHTSFCRRESSGLWSALRHAASLEWVHAASFEILPRLIESQRACDSIGTDQTAC